MTPLRWSHLKNMADSPAHYRYYLDNPITPTSAMRFGSLAHALTLGKAMHKLTVFDQPRRGKAWAEFKEANADKEIYTQDEWERASACADAIKADPVCGPLLKGGVKEQRITWTVNGRECAGTPDIQGGNMLVDLKITAFVSPERFPWHARKMKWHSQLAWYEDGIKAAGGNVLDSVIIAAPPKPPFTPVAYGLTDETIALGRALWRSLFERLMVHEQSDQWPGYAQDVIDLDMEDDGDLNLVIAGEEVTL